MSPDQVLALFGDLSDRCAGAVAANSNWEQTNNGRGQYRVDLDVDAVCVPPLLDAGFAVLSEESGLQWPDRGAVNAPFHGSVVVVDPLDGSTNASLGLPWCATALCLVDRGVPTIAMVTNLVTGRRYRAVRGAGSWRDDTRLAVSPVPLDDALVAVSGLPQHHYGWRQFRSLGASALDISMVAEGAFAGFVDTDDEAHGVWDYLAATLIVEEAGGCAADALGADLVVFDHEARRSPVVAASAELLEQLLEQRSASTSTGAESDE
ncbi:MAG: inositol monophosphatase [Actinomycetota bacterium]